MNSQLMMREQHMTLTFHHTAMQVGGYMRDDSGELVNFLSVSLFSLIILRYTARLNGCSFTLGIHRRVQKRYIADTRERTTNQPPEVDVIPLLVLVLARFFIG